MTTTKRLLVIVSAVLALSIAGLGVLAPIGERASAAGRTYSDKVLSGEYKFHILEVRLTETGELDFCDETGTAVFDGMVSGTVSSTRNCSLPPRVEEDVIDLTYVVFPYGQVEFTDVGGPAGTTNHGWIVDKGASCWSTARRASLRAST